MSPEHSRRRALRRGMDASAVLLALTLVLAACGVQATPSPSVSALPSPTATGVPTPTASPSPTPLPTPNPLNEELLGSRFTILVVGEDVSAARRARGYIGDNTDAIMVVSVSPRQKKVVMLSLPRDNVDIPLGNGQIWSGKVNAIANTYGVDGLRQAMAALLDIEIPYYVKVNMDDFVSLVDAVGGIRVNVKTVVQEPRWGLYLTPGKAHLDGRTALYFSRARYYDSDYARAARQQQVIRALVHKYTNRNTNIDFAQVLLTLAGLDTNLDLAELATLTVLARRAVNADYVAEVLTPPTYALNWGDQHDGRGWVIIPNVDAMRARAHQLMRD
ncbi:MAG TPA: LCP family protein [Candidatus Limnocylindria bacterium]|nr:LCP family protein [Candidatus Limnocylindria bacterium]